MSISSKGIYAGCYQLLRVLLLLVVIPILIACRQSDAVSSKEVLQQLKKQDLAVATFAGGCFWCTESDFDKIHGVVSTISGYMGGHVSNPTYEQVSSGKTGHIEVVQVYYDPARTDFATLLEAFWPTIDPLTPNGQFCDMGPQYRSAIFYHNAKQQALIASSKQTLDNSGRFNQPVVTEILPATEFYPAEDYHQDYYNKNPLRYKYYRSSCGRDDRLQELWQSKQ